MTLGARWIVPAAMWFEWRSQSVWRLRLPGKVSMARLFGDKLLVVCGRKKAFQLTGIFQRHAQHPRAVGVRVNLFRRRRQISIDLGYSSRRGGEQIRDRLHGLDGSKRLPSRKLGSDLRRLHEHDIP